MWKVFDDSYRSTQRAFFLLAILVHGPVALVKLSRWAMKLPGTSRIPALLAGLILFAHSAASSPAAVSPSTSAVDAGPKTVVGTVCSCDYANRTLEILTGCGHALRVVRVAVAQDTKLAPVEAVASISALKPGMIVRVKLRSGPPASVATSIELVKPGEEP